MAACLIVELGLRGEKSRASIIYRPINVEKYSRLLRRAMVATGRSCLIDKVKVADPEGEGLAQGRR
jgi:hypothetical protein